MKKLFYFLTLTTIVVGLSAAINASNLRDCRVEVHGAPEGMEVIASIFDEEDEVYVDILTQQLDCNGETVFEHLVVGQKYSFRTAPYAGYTSASSSDHIMTANSVVYIVEMNVRPQQ